MYLVQLMGFGEVRLVSDDFVLDTGQFWVGDRVQFRNDDEEDWEDGIVSHTDIVTFRG